MEQPTGHPCPECGAPREPDNTPSCACSRRAADALRETRTAQAAAAEDFDPLRIRPYVELDSTPTDSTPPPDTEATMQLHAVTSVIPGTPGLADETSVLPTPSTGTPTGTDTAALATAYGSPDRTDTEHVPRRRRRTALLGAASGAVVAVMAAAGYASGLLSYETPSRDTALPEDIRVSVPDPTTSPASTPPQAPTAQPARPAPAPPAPSASASPSSPSPSPSASSAPPSPSRTPEPTQSRPTASATGSQEASGESAGRDGRADHVLRRGDRGPKVTELQLRLSQLYLYVGEAHGHFDQRVEESLRNYQWSRGIQGDELGVYGEQTRARLESETTEP